MALLIRDCPSLEHFRLLVVSYFAYLPVLSLMVKIVKVIVIWIGHSIPLVPRASLSLLCICWLLPQKFIDNFMWSSHSAITIVIRWKNIQIGLLPFLFWLKFLIITKLLMLEVLLNGMLHFTLLSISSHCTMILKILI